MTAGPRRLVIGVGNALRRDDAAGLALVDRLAGLAPPRLALGRLDGEGVRLLELWDGFDDVVLVDAALGAGPAGRVVELDGTLPLPAGLCRSTHAFGVAEALALARVLDRVPRRVTVLAIVGASFGYGAGLSPPVRAAVERLAVRLAGEPVTRGAGQPAGRAAAPSAGNSA